MRRPDRAEIRRALQVLVGASQTFEIRGLPSGRSQICRGDRLDEAVEAVCRMPAGAGTYWTINPCRGDLDCPAKDADILARRNLLIDFDPVRPADKSATDAEKDTAISVAIRTWEYLSGLTWPDPIAIDSGNGGHLIYAVDLPNDKASQQLVRGVLIHLAEKFDTDRVKVDRAVHNASRISKVPGTWARKGDDSPDRPHRMARLVFVPGSIEVVSSEQLRALAKPDVQPESNGHPRPAVATNGTLSGYVRSAVERECARVALSPVGTRNDALNTASFNLGTMATWDEMDVQGVKRSLYQVATQAGLGERETTKTIESGWNGGALRPRVRPSLNRIQHAQGPRSNGTTQAKSASGTTRDWSSLTDEDLGIKRASQVKKKRIEWVYPERIPKNEYTLVAGRGKQGKSLWTMAAGAKMSTGAGWWDGSGIAPHGHVLYLSAEDDAERVIIPRLEALGADLNNISVLEAKAKLPAPGGKGKLVSFTSLQDLDFWRVVFGRIKDPVALFVDPLPSYLGAGVNDRRNSDVRAILGPFIDLVKEFGMTLIGVTHFGKSPDTKSAVDKILDSIAYVNLARAVHFVSRDPDNPNRILFMPGPCNYARADVPSLAFTLVERTIPDGDGGQLTIAVPEFDPNPVEADADDIVNRQARAKGGTRGPDPVKTTQLAVDLVAFLNGKGPVHLGELFDEFGGQGRLGHRKWNPKKNREEWSNQSALYEAADAVENLPPPCDGWEVVTSKKDPSLRSLTGKVRWALRRRGSPF